MIDDVVGRKAELASLHGRLEGVRLRRPCVLVIEGEPGIGKTSLVLRFLHDAQCTRVLHATGEEFEACLALGVIDQLFRDSDLSWDGLRERLGTEPERTDVLAVGCDILNALSANPHEDPVVLFVDDAHWADLVSLHALAFVARRLRTERILMIFATRETIDERLPETIQRLVAGESGARLRLGGLEAHELRLLAASVGAGPLSPRAAARLHAHTRGNPLHARALLEELPPASLLDGGSLPAPRSFSMLVLARLARCTNAAERLVAAVSVLGGRCGFELAARLADVEDPLAALDEAIAARLLEERDSATERLVSFPHPLVQAAVYRDLGPARRSSLHARAATLVPDEGAWLRHRVAAAQGTEAALAVEVAARARRLATSGAWSEAAETLASAARLTPDQGERERYMLDSFEWLLVGGHTTEAKALEAPILEFGVSARQEYVLGHLSLITGCHMKAESLLASAWRRCDSQSDPSLAAQIAAQLAWVYQARWHSEMAASWASRALKIDPTAARAEHATDVLLLALGLGGGFGTRARARSIVSGQLDETARLALDGLVGRGVVRLWNGDVRGARDDLTAALADHRRHGGSVQLLVVTLASLAESEYRLGDWDESVAHGSLAVTTAEDTEQQWLLAQAHAVAALAHTGRGDWPQAGAHVEAARAVAQAVNTVASTAYAATSQALFSATRNLPTDVLTSLEPLIALPPGAAICIPGVLPWVDLYVDALTALARHDDAELQLAWYEEALGDRQELALATLARLRGNLEAARGNLAAAETAYRAALDVDGQSPQPLERAQIELAYGALLRRKGRRADAAALLSSAHERLTKLGARPFLERCAQELRACGVTRTRGVQSGRSQLTPQEQAVANLVASGCSNRETANKLFLSVKTVEFHLGNVFSKLGIRSRSQLVLKLPKIRERV